MLRQLASWKARHLAKNDAAIGMLEGGPHALVTACARLLFTNFHDRDFSSCLPTSDAQYSTSFRSWSPKAAGKWLSMSSSPMTFPRTNTGTTISDLVSVEHARYRWSRLTLSTTTVLPVDASAPQ